jgi:hypothetical protein
MSAVPIYIEVPNIDDIIRYYDEIEIQYSADDVGTIPKARTGVHALGASQTGTGTSLTNLAGTVLSLDVNGSVVSHTFVGPNPMTIAAVLRELSTELDIEVSSDHGHLKIATEDLGSDSRLTILAGTANAVLGFVEDHTEFGVDMNVDLLPTVTRYTYYDQTSPYEEGYYRYRFVNSATGRQDAWKPWFLGPGLVVVDPASLIQGIIRLADLSGSPIQGAKVTVVNCYSPLVVDTYFVAGASVTIETDAFGVAQTDLFRGALVDVIIEGTSVIRRIQVPVAGTSFDLLEPGLQLDDAFGIQVPDLPAAVRHS